MTIHNIQIALKDHQSNRCTIPINGHYFDIPLMCPPNPFSKFMCGLGFLIRRSVNQQFVIENRTLK